MGLIKKILLAILCFILLCLAVHLTGCASCPFKISGWGNDSERVNFENGQKAEIIGNPRITCYTKYGRVLADGYFVRVEDEYLVVDEFGKDYVYIQNNDLGNYCSLWEQR